jgi:hypothetical protein
MILSIRRLLVLCMLLPALALATDEPPLKAESAGAEAPQPKFIWGILIKFAASKAFDMFSEWAVKNMFEGMAPSLIFTRGEALTPAGAAELAPLQKSATPLVPNLTDKAPTAPVLADSGRENYQGVLISLLVLQPDEQTLKVRPVSEGFKSGEKFRLRLGATFDGELSVDNINPAGKRDRLYPVDTGQVIKIRKAMPVILPLDKDSFFEFDDDRGEENMVITLRDPRARGNATALTPVHRQENAQGTGLLQEVAAGKYAAIAESISLSHR